MDPAVFTMFMAIGLVAGMAGGLLGIGGSAIFIPAASLLVGADQQIYQAAAMILNVFVAASATVKHWRSRGIDLPVVARMIPFAVAAVVIGVFASNHIDGTTLARGFGVMLLVLGCFESGMLIARFLRSRSGETPRTPATETDASEPTRAKLPYRITGAVMGGLGGLLGIGGGVVGVPLLRFAARQPIRRAIAVTAAVTLPLALIGALYKNIALPHLPGEDATSSTEALLISAAIVPTAIIGSWCGASLVHRLPIDLIRVAFVVLLFFAGYRMTTRNMESNSASISPPTVNDRMGQSTEGTSSDSQPAPTAPTIPKMGNSAS